MKPGNLLIQGAKSGGIREMRIRTAHIESSVCGFFARLPFRAGSRCFLQPRKPEPGLCIGVREKGIY